MMNDGCGMSGGLGADISVNPPRIVNHHMNVTQILWAVPFTCFFEKYLFVLLAGLYCQATFFSCFLPGL